MKKMVLYLVLAAGLTPAFFASECLAGGFAFFLDESGIAFSSDSVGVSIGNGGTYVHSGYRGYGGTYYAPYESYTHNVPPRYYRNDYGYSDNRNCSSDQYNHYRKERTHGRSHQEYRGHRR